MTAQATTANPAALRGESTQCRSKAASSRLARAGWRLEEAEVRQGALVAAVEPFTPVTMRSQATLRADILAASAAPMAVADLS